MLRRRIGFDVYIVDQMVSTLLRNLICMDRLMDLKRRMDWYRRVNYFKWEYGLVFRERIVFLTGDIRCFFDSWSSGIIRIVASIGIQLDDSNEIDFHGVWISNIGISSWQLLLELYFGERSKASWIQSMIFLAWRSVVVLFADNFPLFHLENKYRN